LARSESAIVNWSQYLAVRGVAGFLQCFDVQQNLDTARMVGSVFYHASTKRRRRTERNIAMSFPEWSEERVNEVALAASQNMFQLFMVDALTAPRLITPGTWPAYFSLHGVERVLDDLLHGRPAIFITGHCGNWELLGYGLSMLGYSLNALARPIDNPLVNQWLLKHREARGLRIITKFGAAPEIQEVLRQGGRLGFIADQNAGEQGLFVPFFGRLASSYKSIGLLAMRYNVPVIAAHGRRVGSRLRYAMEVVDFIDPEDWQGQPDPLYYITARYNRAIETMVRRAPEQYLWIHRRWKSRPKHERLGKPVPATLRRRLEALPWMEPDELERIIALSEDPEHREVA
jgi:KDO2-lipid IV(A) lauroyltransferase